MDVHKGAPAAAGAGEKVRACAVSSCGSAIRAGRFFCETHWAALPGKTRSGLSMSARSPMTDGTRNAVARAALALEAA